MEKIIDIPFISQHSIKEEKWKNKVCSLVCLKMSFDFFDIKDVYLENLLKEALFLNSQDSGNDWTHNKLVMLARNHGLNAYGQEFKSFDFKKREYIREEEFFLEGVRHLSKAIDGNVLPMISVYKGLLDSGSNHMVLVSGYKKDNGKISGFFINDSDKKIKEEGKNIYISIEEFKKTWRKLVIFLYPLEI